MSSINSEINRIQTNVNNAFDVLENQYGVNVLSTDNSDLLATRISEIRVSEVLDATKEGDTVTITKFNGDEITIKEGIQTHNGHAYVDLGLPSGTLWATCNVGAYAPEVYGDYYAWGETETKTTYNWSTYFDSFNGSSSNFKKYATNKKTQLDPEDDAAHVNWGGDWRMPTREEQEELRTKCSWMWIPQDGVDGYIVIGPNGNSIFLPTAGYRYNNNLDNATFYGYYWSSSLDKWSSSDAYYICFASDIIDLLFANRANGRSIRPVFKRTIHLEKHNFKNEVKFDKPISVPEYGGVRFGKKDDEVGHLDNTGGGTLELVSKGALRIQSAGDINLIGHLGYKNHKDGPNIIEYKNDYLNFINDDIHINAKNNGNLEFNEDGLHIDSTMINIKTNDYIDLDSKHAHISLKNNKINLAGDSLDFCTNISDDKKLKINEDIIKLRLSENISLTLDEQYDRINLVAPEIRWIEKLLQENGTYIDKEHSFSEELGYPIGENKDGSEVSINVLLHRIYTCTSAVKELSLLLDNNYNVDSEKESLIIFNTYYNAPAANEDLPNFTLSLGERIIPVGDFLFEINKMYVISILHGMAVKGEINI